MDIPLSLQGVTWNDSKRGRSRTTLVGALLTGALAAGMGAAPAALAAPSATAGTAHATGVQKVIVRAETGKLAQAAQSVRDAGGTVQRRMDILQTLSAKVPAGALDRLRHASGVATVSTDGAVTLSSDAPDTLGTYTATTDPNSVYNSLVAMGAPTYYKNGFTGKGVDVAVLDSGVSPVQGLHRATDIVYGPDLTQESQSPEVRNLDTFGHGTFMAGLIGGKDDAWSATNTATTFAGAAPDARIVSVKASDAVGATDVSQVLAGIDWIVAHKRDNGLNIRVLNLSFGTDSEQSYLLDPLTFAVEQAWKHGIFVVVSAGNHGNGTTHTMTNPATDPYVLAVGAEDTTGTTNRVDDTIPAFSSWGTAERMPDLVAPGKSVTSLRDPGSFLDLNYPLARQGERFFRGSGTSQAAAYASGAAALVIQQRPKITPDQLKDLLTSSALQLKNADPVAQGAGGLDLGKAFSTPTNLLAVQKFASSTGLGSLDQARGSSHLNMDGVELNGEVDFQGKKFSTAAWAPLAASGTSWSGGDWNGTSWSGTSWSGTSWSGTSWSGTSWSGTSWSGTSWSGTSWSGTSWSGTSWSGTSWSDADWA